MAKIAFLVDEGFEDTEFQRPYDAMKEAGHFCVVVGPEAGKRCEGKHGGFFATVEMSAADATVEEFDALVIPGGKSPERLRRDPEAVRLTRDLVKLSKPVAAICHGPQVLIDAEVLDGRKATSAAAIKTDLANAGATWRDEEVVEDGPVITSRRPLDLDAFIAALRRRLDA